MLEEIDYRFDCLAMVLHCIWWLGEMKVYLCVMGLFLHFYDKRKLFYYSTIRQGYGRNLYAEPYEEIKEFRKDISESLKEAWKDLWSTD